MRRTEVFSDSTPAGILYHEGDQLRRLRGRVEDLDRLGFLRVEGVSKLLFINPSYIERVEVREGEDD